MSIENLDESIQIQRKKSSIVLLNLILIFDKVAKYIKFKIYYTILALY